MDQKQAIIALAESYASHAGITHWAVSMRIFGKGDFFYNLNKPNGDCRTRTAARVFQWFADNWDDQAIEWPAGIERPAPPSKRTAVA